MKQNKVENASYFLGLDTSCYTTSCALLDNHGNLISEERRLLSVPEGKRGLAQSNMVFQHVRALPELLKKLPIGASISAIGVSAFPRRAEDSYMPAFLVGKGMGESMGHVLQCPLYHFSHQENHIMAALRELKEMPQGSFLALQVSGGTTELLRGEVNEDNPQNDSLFSLALLSERLDFNGGQCIDRLGVAMGLAFPAGPAMERLALQAEQSVPLPIAVKDGCVSFSGPTSEALRRWQALQAPTEEDRQIISRSILECIGQSIVKMLRYHIAQKRPEYLIAVGGVMSNYIIRSCIQALADELQLPIYFASPQFSSDNATGNAYGAFRKYYQNLDSSI